MDFGIEFIRRLRPCKWRYDGPLDDGVEHFGFIAQEVQSITGHEQYGFVKYDQLNGYGLVMSEFIGPLVKAVQELDEELTKLKKEIYATPT
jgi:hypothetical protein